MVDRVSVLDHVAGLDPRLANQVTRLGSDLSERLIRKPREGFLEEREGFLEEHGLSEETVRAILADDAPPSGIFGAGVTTVDESRLLYPAVFVLPGLAGKPMEPVSIWDTQAISLVARYTRNLPKELFAVGIPIPTELNLNFMVTVGGELSCEGTRGTCGVEVVTRTGERSVLTAGHVAKAVGSLVTTAGKTVGSVTLTDYLGLHSPADIVADVGVVKSESHLTIATTHLTTGPGTGKQFDNVVTDVQQGTREGWIRSVVPSFALRTDVGCWGEILITDRAVSDPGDSGAPVYLDDDTGTVIGHVVAGDSNAYTLIQDINFILNRGGATLA